MSKTSSNSCFNFDDTMASLFNRALRAVEPGVCRQCAGQPARRTLASYSTQTPKCQIRSRSSISSRALRAGPTARNGARSTPNIKLFSASSRRAYKTVEEAKSRYKAGVSPNMFYCLQTLLKDIPSPSHGKQASSSSLQAPA